MQWMGTQAPRVTRGVMATIYIQAAPNESVSNEVSVHELSFKTFPPKDLIKDRKTNVFLIFAESVATL